MAKYAKLTTDWVAFSDIIGEVAANTVYKIQNKGSFDFIGINSDTLPNKSEKGGDPTAPRDYGLYIKGTKNLYLRAANNDTTIYVTNLTAGE